MTAARALRFRLPAVGWVGLGLVASFAAVGIAGPSVAGYDPRAVLDHAFESPSFGHLLGTNHLSQDLASQLLVGARAALAVAVTAGLGTVLLGGLVGITAGWAGGKVDGALMALVDLMVGIPRLLLLLVVGAYVGRSLFGLAVLLSLISWPGPARMIRSHVQSLKSRLHVRAAASFGASTGHIIRRHVLPDVSLVALTAFVGAAGRAVMFESGLTFLSLGDPNRVSWGTMIRQAHATPGLYFMKAYLWWMLPPVVAIILVLLGFTLLGTALEERVNPRLARHPGGRR